MKKKNKLKVDSNWNKLNKSKKVIKYTRDLHFPKFTIHYGDSKTPDGLTQSLIQAFLKCRREFLYKMNLWASEGKRTTFANGSITHDTLDKVYTYFKKKNKLPSDALIKKWVNEYDKKNPKWLPKGNEDSEKFKAVCYVMVTEYIRYYKSDFKKGRVVGIEDVFDIRWKGFRLRGKKDLTFNIKKRRWIMETKTSARISEETLIEKLAFDFQNLFYVNAEQIEQKVQVDGVLYNIIRNPGLKFTEASLRAYCERLRKDVRARGDHYFKRFEIPYTEADKEDFKKELLVILKEIRMLISTPKKQAFSCAYKNTKNCTGQFNCSFLRACSTGTLDGYIKAKSLFKELEDL